MIIEGEKVCECRGWNRENIKQPIDVWKDGFAVWGCCGGGCVVIKHIIFCPFCGRKLKIPEEVD